MGGDPTGVHHNVNIEKWAAYRENTHLFFKFTPRTSALALVFGVAVPLTIYFGIRNTQVRALIEARRAPNLCY